MSSWWSGILTVINYIFGSNYEQDLIVCDTVPGLASFEAERYMGRWFSIWHAKDIPFQSEDDLCITGTYSNLRNGNEFDVFNGVENENFDGRSGLSGTAKCYEQDPPGQCQITWWW